MLTKTGDNLVSDVKTCLEFIGFEQVRDVDREIKHKSQTSRKQEDLQFYYWKSKVYRVFQESQIYFKLSSISPELKAVI
jgi:hypothetical protein